jgi:hypothetical protein
LEIVIFNIMRTYRLRFPHKQFASSFQRSLVALALRFKAAGTIKDASDELKAGN